MQSGIKRSACLNQQRRASENVCTRNDMMQCFVLQIRTVAANVLNKTADKGLCSSLVIGGVTNKSSP